MGLGCILCRKPLVNYVAPRRINWAKANGIDTSLPSFHEQYQQKNLQVWASTCGHLFHKHCLRNYFATQSKKNAGYKTCPYCNEQFTLAQCFPIHLKPQDDQTSTEMKRILYDNNQLQQNLVKLKKLLKKRENKLQNLTSDIEKLKQAAESGHNGDGNTKDGKINLGFLETDDEEVRISAYSNLNQRLVSMIEQSIEMEEGMWNPQKSDFGGTTARIHNYTQRPRPGRFNSSNAPRSKYPCYSSGVNLMSEARPSLGIEKPYSSYPSFQSPSMKSTDYFHRPQNPYLNEIHVKQNDQESQTSFQCPDSARRPEKEKPKKPQLIGNQMHRHSYKSTGYEYPTSNSNTHESIPYYFQPSFGTTGLNPEHPNPNTVSKSNKPSKSNDNPNPRTRISSLKHSDMTNVDYDYEE